MKDDRWVLVVDDDESIRELIGIILESKGIAVETAGEGCEALAHLHHESAPALVLLDLMMPGMDGLELIEEVRRDERLSAIPIVVISGDQRATRKLAHADVQDCMVKPIELDDLLQTVDRYVR